MRLPPLRKGKETEKLNDGELSHAADMLRGGDAAKSERVMRALLQMTKIDIAALRQAYEGKL